MHGRAFLMLPTAQGQVQTPVLLSSLRLHAVMKGCSPAEVNFHVSVAISSPIKPCELHEDFDRGQPRMLLSTPERRNKAGSFEPIEQPKHPQAAGFRILTGCLHQGWDFDGESLFWLVHAPLKVNNTCEDCM